MFYYRVDARKIFIRIRMHILAMIYSHLMCVKPDTYYI